MSTFVELSSESLHMAYKSDQVVERYSANGQTVWPVSLDAVKANAQIYHSEDDSVIEEKIAEATDAVEALAKIAFVRQKRRCVLDASPIGRQVELPLGPVTSVDSVSYVDSAGAVQSVDVASVRIAGHAWPPVISLRTDWPAADDDDAAPYTIDYWAGYGTSPNDVPARWRQVIKAYATVLWEHRELQITGNQLIFNPVERLRSIIAATGGGDRYV